MPESKIPTTEGALPLPPPVILPRSDLSTPAWKARKFRDNHALGRGGDVDIVRNAGGKLAAFVADPAKLTDKERAEIAQILAEPKYHPAAKAQA